MTRVIVFLKGINVGGHKKVPMEELRKLLTNEGFENVQTYIQSGNIILQSSESNLGDIEETIKKAILDHFGFDMSAILKTKHDIKRIFDDCPFFEEKKKASFFTMLHDNQMKYW